MTEGNRLRVPLIGVLCLALCACGLPGGTGGMPGEPAGVAEPPEVAMETPPLAKINGVGGVLATFCWQGGCADAFGHPPPATLPSVSPPFQIWLPLPASELQVTAVGPGESGNEIPLEETNLVVSGPLPQGTVSVKVGVWFEAGGDAFYYWAVEPSQQDEGDVSPSPTP